MRAMPASSVPRGRRLVGIAVPFAGPAVDGGTAHGWCLPRCAVAMAYDRIYLQVAQAGRGHLVPWAAQGARFRRGDAIPVALHAGFNTLPIALTVPAGGTVSYEPQAAAALVLGGFSASTAHNFSLPCGGAPGAVASATPTSADYGLGAAGMALGTVPAPVARVAGPKRYVIGVWNARAQELATWAARGVNTAIGLEDDFTHAGDAEAWHRAWRASGLDLVHRPGRWRTPGWQSADTRAQALAEAANPRVIAWNLIDEPDVFGHPAQPGYRGAFDPDLTRSMLDREVDDLRKAGPAKPIFCNLSGYDLSLGLLPWKTRFLDDPHIDWWGFDQYPNVGAPAGFLMFEQTGAERFVSTCIGLTVAQIVQTDFNYGGCATPAASRGKPVLFAVATGRVQGARGLAEDPARWRAIVLSGVINGACGHYYFPQYLDGPDGYVSDDTGAPILAAMAHVHAVIGVLHRHGALIDPVHGGRRAFRRRPCAFAPMTAHNQTATFIAPRDDQLPGPFEGCEIDLPHGDTLRLVLNLTGTVQVLHDPHWGYAGLRFAPWQAQAFLARSPHDDLLAGLV